MRRVLDKLKRRKVTVPRRHAELAFVSGADLDLEDWIPEALTDQGRKEWVRAHHTAHRVVRLMCM